MIIVGTTFFRQKKFRKAITELNVKTDKELHTLPNPVADVLNAINDTNSLDNHNNLCYNDTKLSSNSVTELWNPTLKAMNLAMGSAQGIHVT